MVQTYFMLVPHTKIPQELNYIKFLKIETFFSKTGNVLLKLWAHTVKLLLTRLNGFLANFRFFCTLRMAILCIIHDWNCPIPLRCPRTKISIATIVGFGRANKTGPCRECRFPFSMVSCRFYLELETRFTYSKTIVLLY